MQANILPYWDLSSAILYCIMGIVPLFAINQTINHPSNNAFWKNKFYLIWILIWIVFASFRHVGNGLGGTDAPNYLTFFDHCFHINGFTGSVEQYYNNLGFRWYNQIVYLINPTDRFYLIVTYGILTIGVVYFVNFFKFEKESSIPFFLLVFWYLRGFSSIRSNLATIILLTSFVFLYKKKYFASIVFIIIAYLIHSSAALYALFVPFYIFYKKHIGYKKLIILIIVLFIISIPLQNLFLQNVNFFGDDFSDHYSYYVTMGDGFFSNFWKIAFEQLLLLMLMMLNKNGLIRYKTNLNQNNQKKFDFIYRLCLYDFLLVPICSTLNIWSIILPNFSTGAKVKEYCLSLH